MLKPNSQVADRRVKNFKLRGSKPAGIHFIQATITGRIKKKWMDVFISTNMNG